MNRRNKKRRACVLRSPKQLPITPAEKLSQEMLEKIFTNVESKRDLVTCRLVSKLWTAFATSVLQTRCHDIAEWNPLLHPLKGTTPPVLQLHLYDPADINFVIKPAAMKETEVVRDVNPLFSQSLRLIGDNDYYGCRDPNKKLKLVDVLSVHGNSLLSLSLVGCSATRRYLVRILKLCQNLEFLQIQRLNLDWWVGKPELSRLPKLLKFTSLDCAKSPKVYHWLLKYYANQLERIVSLDTSILPFKTENYPVVDKKADSDWRPFEKLKELKVVRPSGKFVWETGLSIPLQLERLSVIFPSRDISCNELCEFTSRFQSSLKELTIDSQLNELNNPVGTGVNNHEHQESYPHLHKFSMNGGWDEPQQMVLIKQHFLSNFPNLGTLLVVFEKDLLLEDAWEYAGFHQLWSFCQNLNTIEFIVNTGCHANPVDVNNATQLKLTRKEWEERNGN